MDSFETVAGASSVTYSMVAEGRPVSNTRQHVISARGEVVLGCLKDATTKNQFLPLDGAKCESIPLEPRNIVCRTRVLVRWLADGSRPPTVRSWKGRVDRMESIMIPRIVNADSPPIRGSDGDLPQGNHLIRRDSIHSPVPIWVA